MNPTTDNRKLQQTTAMMMMTTFNHLLRSCFGILGLRDHRHQLNVVTHIFLSVRYTIPLCRSDDDDDCRKCESFDAIIKCLVVA